jgi:hypothetical protein
MPRRTLVVNGCSHAAGSDIDPLDVEPSGWSAHRAFGKHLADSLGWDYVNIAMPGGSNERIVRTTIEWVGQASRDPSQPPPFVLVMWTGHARFEVYDDRRCCWLNLCPGIEATPYFDDYSFELQRYFRYHVLVRTTRTETATRFWLDVVLLQSYLEAKGIDYLFCNGYQSLDNGADFEVFARQLNRRRYYEPFDNSRSFWWQLKHDGYRVRVPPDGVVPRGFQGHYGEDGHRRWADRMLEVLEQLEQRS